MKRKADILTGGTGDINPQYLSGEIAMLAANSLHDIGFSLPITRFQQNPNKSQVFEVLRVTADMPSNDQSYGATLSTISSFMSFSTKPMLTTAGTLLSNASVFARFEKITGGTFTAAGTGLQIDQIYQHWDCTDGAGHGILVATDQFHVAVTTLGYGGAGETFRFKILYRMKNISLAEYIGIVQSQQ